MNRFLYDRDFRHERVNNWAKKTPPWRFGRILSKAFSANSLSWNFSHINRNGLFQKNANRGGRREEGLRAWNSRGIEKIERGNSRSQLKKTWTFLGWSRKNHVEFSWVLVFSLGISKWCNTVLWCEAFLSGISKGKVENLKMLKL